jgi:hypothetical protein
MLKEFILDLAVGAAIVGLVAFLLINFILEILIIIGTLVCVLGSVGVCLLIGEAIRSKLKERREDRKNSLTL